MIKDFTGCEFVIGASVIFVYKIPYHDMPELRVGIVAKIDAYGIVLTTAEGDQRRLASDTIVKSVGMICALTED